MYLQSSHAQVSCKLMSADSAMPCLPKTVASRGHPQNSIMPTQPYQYHTYSHLQGPSSYVMLQQQQQQQQFYEAPRHYPTAQVHQPQPGQLSPRQYGEMSHVPVDYSQCRTYTSPARSTLVAPRSLPITMRIRRVPYTIPQDTATPGEQRQDVLSVWDTPSPSVQAPTLPKEEPAFREDMTGLQETSLSAGQSVPSPVESRPLRPPALAPPAASEIVSHAQSFIWAEEQAKPAPPVLEDDCSSSSQPPSPAMPGTVFIHSNVPRTSTTPADANEDYEEYKNYFPEDTDQHKRLRIAMHDVMTSEWKIRDELEPTSRDLLQFCVKTVGAEGSTTFKCLMYHNKKPCEDTWNRAERALAHVRKFIDLRPFPCEGYHDAPGYALLQLLELRAYYISRSVNVGCAFSQKTHCNSIGRTLTQSSVNTGELFDQNHALGDSRRTAIHQ